jgi:outer membrane protein OmpA-like peptidoglycan-associated protein
MKKFFFYAAMVFLFSAVYLPTHGQLNADGLKIGLQGSVLAPMNDFWQEFDNYEFSYLGRGFFRFPVAKGLEAEIGGGYGRYQGLDYANNYGVPQAKYVTDIIPIDFRLLIHLSETDKWNPYLFIGAGGIHYQVKYYDKPNAHDFQNPQYWVSDEDWAAMVPAGFGAKWKLSETVLFEAQASLTYAFTENLNYYNEDGTMDDAYAALSLGLTFQSDRGNSDDDKDSLIQKEEKLLGTDPKNPDTDADGLKDGEEVNKLKTDPLKADTDADGLNDGDEVLKYKTDPLKSDTEVDGVNDKDELMQYKTDPLKADTDADGLKDGEELMKYKTDPLKADTDADGLKDGEEVTKYMSDPTKVDTDGDGLKDGEEVTTLKTNPIKRDTDGGTVDDGVEVKRGTDPLKADDDVVKVGVPIILQGLTFATGKADITPEGEKVLDPVLRTLNTYPEIEVEISGHTDNVGKKASNVKLSQKRADSVRSWLISKGVDPKRLTAKGYGPDKPIVPNDTPENKRLNRRIEFQRTK